MMDELRRQRVTERAGNRCEYCHLEQEHEPFSLFHVDHVIARQHRVDESDENLCLACSSCNLHKGPNIAGLDPNSGALTPLFHPRLQNWTDHFEWNHVRLVGKTSCGRTTIHVLAINSSENLELREALLDEGASPH